MSELIVVNSKVKDEISKAGKSLAGNYSEKLSEKVKMLIQDSIQRASDNGRSTVMAKDL